MKDILLVNKTHPLNKDYVPKSLVKVPAAGEKLDPNHQIMLIDYVYEAFKNLAKEAPFEMVVDSGYRTYEYQQEILEDYLKKDGEIAYTRVALPGTSEHQTGLAVDYAFIIDGEIDDDVEKYPEYNEWVHKNCYKYGFILRYLKGKEDITGYQYEPWHLRYVGKYAEKIAKSGLTLEEILEQSDK